MPTQTTDLFLSGDLDGAGAPAAADDDRSALRAVSDWIADVVVKPHPDLGRPGPVCPFVPGSLERGTLWLAPVQVGDGGMPDVVEVLDRYKRMLLAAAPTEGDDVDHKVVVAVFTDVSAERASSLFGDALGHIAVPSYAEDGIVFGPFFQGNPGTAIYNSGFRPFQSPVPFGFVRFGVVGDWKFFIDDPQMTGHWARRFGEGATLALAEEVRRLPWWARRD